MDVEFNITGLDEALAKLRNVNATVAKSGTRAAARRAMLIARNAAREGAKRLDDPESREQIWRNIVVNMGKSRDKNVIVAKVGVRGGAKSRKGGGTYAVGGSSANPGGDTFYWRFLEFGTSKMPAQPFMRNALSRNIQKITDTFVSELSTQIDKAAARFAKRQAR